MYIIVKYIYNILLYSLIIGYLIIIKTTQDKNNLYKFIFLL